MPNAVHFTAKIFNLDMNINGLEQGKNYYYDDMTQMVRLFWTTGHIKK